MHLSRRNMLLCAAALLLPSSSLFAQKVSPAATAEIELGGKKITIQYSRPYMKGRTIMGGLVPYGKVWRTGADDATALHTDADLDIGGLKVPAGNYTLYTLPSADTWKLIINKQTGQWGTEYDQSQDLGRVDLQKASTDHMIDQFIIRFVKTGADSADLILEWEKTKLSVPVRARH